MLISSFGIIASAAGSQNTSTPPAAGTRAASNGVSLATLISAYKTKNPNAAEHQITVSHKLVYDADTYFKDNVNATTSMFSCYSKLGADEIKTALGNRQITVGLIADTTSASGKEILVGKVERSAETAILSKVDFNEYGIFVTADNIILFAWNDAALRVCVGLFVNYIASSITLPVGFEFVGVADADWKDDFVRPDNTALSSSQYLNDDSVQLLYTGTGATKAGYTAYCSKLASDGFVSVWTNTIDNNVFGMYKNTAKNIALYVAYNDYTYSSEYAAKYTANYTSATNAYLPMEYTKCIRIVSSPLSATVLPEESNSKQSYTKITDSYLTTLGIESGKVGTGHIITLEDGRFIVIDGGNCGCSGNTWCSHVNLIWNTLMTLYKKIHGHEPTAAEPIHLAGWYLTHAHSDHYAAFYSMLRLINSDQAKKNIFKLDYLIANIPGADALFKNTSTTWGHSSSFETFKNFLGGTKLIKPYAGQKLHFANVTIEVLMTFGDHLPRVINNTNDTNTITRFHIQSGNKTTSAMFLGDSWRGASRFLCAMYGPYLDSDISQIAHHGNIGAEKELYQAIAPRGIIFNNTLDTFKTYVWGNATSSNPESKHAFSVDRYVVRELESVNYVWTAVSGKTPTVKFTADGAQYGSAFDLNTGNALDYKSDLSTSTYQTGFVERVHEHKYVATSIDSTHHQYKCKCGDVSGNLEAHTREADDNNCATATKCKDCGYIFVAAKSHTPAADDGDCTTAIMCTDCSRVAVAARRHTSVADDGDCTTAVKCKHCNYIMVSAKTHEAESDDNDCTTATKCKHCSYIFVAAKSHTPAADDGDCTTATKCSECGSVVIEATEHLLDEAGTFCEACGMTLDTKPVATKPVATAAPTVSNVTKLEKVGCKGTVSLTAVALIASLGACAIFAEKKRK